MNSGYLDKVFFEPARWQEAINIGVTKNINRALLQELCSPDARLKLHHELMNGEYVVETPHEALIPKEDKNEFRTVVINEPRDRIILSIVNQMIFDLCPELIHKNCKSYQKGIGCGKTVLNIVDKINKLKGPKIGIKADLSKYFDTVNIEEIDKVFDYIDNKHGKSAIMDATRTFYHTNTVIDINKNVIERYSSLRQGCAFAAFLADAVLYDIDDTISKLDVLYIRYSDDILILGREWKKALKILETMLKEKGLALNPKKVEILEKTKWFKFLGFTIKGNQISLSKTRIKKFQKDIESITIHSDVRDTDMLIRKVHRYLYNGDGQYSWATSVLPIINVEKDIDTLNNFVMDCIRAAHLGKPKIGGLGCATDKTDHTIKRGKGNHTKNNMLNMPFINGYYTIRCMRKNLLTSREAYRCLISQL